MSFYRGPKVVTEGLVFGYDTGYPVVSGSSDSYRFNLGEPTANVLDDTIQGGRLGASLGSDSFGEFIQLGDNTSGYSYLRLPSITLSSNETYTWSFELYTTETFDRGTNNYSFDQNEYSDQFPSSNDASRASFSQSQPNSIPAGQWTPFKLTVTMKDSLTGAFTVDLFRFYYPAFQNKKVYYRNMQFERDKDHKTPYVGQGGSRSVSGSLLDLTGNRSINLSNVSFNSDAQMTFNGTDSRIDTTLNHISGSDHTEEVVVYRNATGTTHGILSDLQYGYYGLYIDSANKVKYRQMQQVSDGQGGFTYPAAVATSTTTLGTGFYHIVGSFSSANGFRVYVNGELDGTNGTDLPFNPTGTRGINHIGVYKDSNATTYNHPFDGRIDIVKCYDRELTQEEVSNNFNAIKNRFNL